MYIVNGLTVKNSEMNDEEKIKGLLRNYSKGDSSALIPVLQDIQDSIGFLSEDIIVLVGQYFDIPSSRVYGIATFYNQFRFTKKAKYHIELCNGTSCFLENGLSIQQYIQDKIDQILNVSDAAKLFSIERVPCMGACAFSPVMLLNSKLYTNLTKRKIDDLFDNLVLEV